MALSFFVSEYYVFKLKSIFFHSFLIANNISHSSSSRSSTKPPRDELFGLKKERDLLAARLSDMERDQELNLAQTNQLLAEVGALSAEKRYLEERLATLHSSHWASPGPPGGGFTPVKSYEVSVWQCYNFVNNPAKLLTSAGIHCEDSVLSDLFWT